jgi:predicted nucleic acid-binding protein
LLLDTSTVIEILRNPKSSDRFRLVKEQIKNEELYMLTIQLAELSDWCIRNNAPPIERIESVKHIANIVPLDEEICLEGSKIKSTRRRTGHKNFSLLDGLVLAAARSLGERLLTFDRHFTGEKDCIVLA